MAVYKSSLPVRHESIGDLTITLAGSDNTTIADVLTVDSAFGAAPNGMAFLGKYEATPSTYDDGDAVPLLTDASGRLQVTADTEIVVSYDYKDDSAFNVGSDRIAAIGNIYDDITTDSVDEGDIGLPRMTADRISLSILDDGTDRLALLKDADTYDSDTAGVLVLGQNGTANYQALKVDSDGALYVNTGRVGSLTEATGSVNCVKDTPVTVVTHTPGADEEILGVTYGGSGKAQVDIYYGVTVSEVRKHTFYTSASNPNVDFEFSSELELTALDTIYISVTNLETVASPTSDFTGYATISYVTV